MELQQRDIKNLDFNKDEYNYFIDSCNFTDRQMQVLNLRRKGKSIIEISFILYVSERTINREIKEIKRKILKLI